MEGEEIRGGEVMGDGDVSADVMEKGSLSPLTGSYLLIVLAEPHSEEDREIILQRLNKGLLSWDVDSSHVDLNCELLNLTNSNPEGDEARNGEKLVQWASENLVVEVLIHSQVNTLQQCMKNLLASFTRHRHIIHAGYTFQGSGSWVLQDGTFSLSDYLDLWGEGEVQRILSAYKGDISVSMHCANENGWTQERLCKEPFAKLCQITINPEDKMSQIHNSGIGAFSEFISKMLIPSPIKEILEPSDIVGNIRFSHPTLYVFPGGQGDAALFGINGFNMLIDGGFARKACFWDFTRHLDRLDAVLLTRINNNSVGGLSSVIQRKMMSQVYPQIGHFFGNVMERKGGSSEEKKDESAQKQEKLLVSLNDEGHRIVENLRNINLKPHLCFRETHIEPINLYHKVGHGKLDLYVLNPAKDSREVKEFLSKWNSDCKSFVSSRMSSRSSDGKDFQFPILNLVSICALLVWQPANPRDPITRILFPGSTPQHKIFEALGKLKHLEFLRYPVCTAKTIAASHRSQAKSEKVISEAKEQLSKVGSHSNVQSIHTSSTDGSLSRSHVSKTSSTSAVHRSSSHSKVASASSLNKDSLIKESSLKDSMVKEDTTSTTARERPAKRAVSKSVEDSNKIQTSSPSQAKRQIKATSKSTLGKAPSTGAGKEAPKKKEPQVPATAAKKTSPTSPARKIESKVKTLSKLGSAKDSPPQTPPKSAKDANNRRVIEHKSIKSKTDSGQLKPLPRVDIKKRAPPAKSSIPTSVGSKSPTKKSVIPKKAAAGVATAAGVTGAAAIEAARRGSKETKATKKIPDDPEGAEKKIQAETNGTTCSNKQEEMQEQEDQTQDDQPSSLQPASLPFESGSELSSLDHISVQEETASTSDLSKEQFDSETLQPAESEQEEEEEEYLIVEKDESTDNAESERVLTKTLGSLDEPCPSIPEDKPSELLEGDVEDKFAKDEQPEVEKDSETTDISKDEPHESKQGQIQDPGQDETTLVNKEEETQEAETQEEEEEESKAVEIQEEITQAKAAEMETLPPQKEILETAQPKEEETEQVESGETVDASLKSTENIDTASAQTKAEDEGEGDLKKLQIPHTSKSDETKKEEVEEESMEQGGEQVEGKEDEVEKEAVQETSRVEETQEIGHKELEKVEKVAPEQLDEKMQEKVDETSQEKVEETTPEKLEETAEEVEVKELEEVREKTDDEIQEKGTEAKESDDDKAKSVAAEAQEETADEKDEGEVEAMGQKGEKEVGEDSVKNCVTETESSKLGLKEEVLEPEDSRGIEEAGVALKAEDEKESGGELLSKELEDSNDLVERDLPGQLLGSNQEEQDKLEHETLLAIKEIREEQQQGAKLEKEVSPVGKEEESVLDTQKPSGQELEGEESPNVETKSDESTHAEVTEREELSAQQLQLDSHEHPINDKTLTQPQLDQSTPSTTSLDTKQDDLPTQQQLSKAELSHQTVPEVDRSQVESEAQQESPEVASEPKDEVLEQLIIEQEQPAEKETIQEKEIKPTQTSPPSDNIEIQEPATPQKTPEDSSNEISEKSQKLETSDLIPKDGVVAEIVAQAPEIEEKESKLEVESTEAAGKEEKSEQSDATTEKIQATADDIAEEAAADIAVDPADDIAEEPDHDDECAKDSTEDHAEKIIEPVPEKQEESLSLAAELVAAEKETEKAAERALSQVSAPAEKSPHDETSDAPIPEKSLELEETAVKDGQEASAEATESKVKDVDTEKEPKTDVETVTKDTEEIQVAVEGVAENITQKQIHVSKTAEVVGKELEAEKGKEEPQPDATVEASIESEATEKPSADLNADPQPEKVQLAESMEKHESKADEPDENVAEEVHAEKSDQEQSEKGTKVEQSSDLEPPSKLEEAAPEKVSEDLEKDTGATEIPEKASAEITEVTASTSASGKTESQPADILLEKTTPPDSDDKPKSEVAEPEITSEKIQEDTQGATKETDQAEIETTIEDQVQIDSSKTGEKIETAVETNVRDTLEAKIAEPAETVSKPSSESEQVRPTESITEGKSPEKQEITQKSDLPEEIKSQAQSKLPSDKEPQKPEVPEKPDKSDDLTKVLQEPAEAKSFPVSEEEPTAEKPDADVKETGKDATAIQIQDISTSQLEEVQKQEITQTSEEKSEQLLPSEDSTVKEPEEGASQQRKSSAAEVEPTPELLSKSPSPLPEPQVTERAESPPKTEVPSSKSAEIPASETIHDSVSKAEGKEVAGQQPEEQSKAEEDTTEISTGPSSQLKQEASEAKSKEWEDVPKEEQISVAQAPQSLLNQKSEQLPEQPPLEERPIKSDKKITLETSEKPLEKEEGDKLEDIPTPKEKDASFEKLLDPLTDIGLESAVQEKADSISKGEQASIESSLEQVQEKLDEPPVIASEGGEPLQDVTPQISSTTPTTQIQQDEAKLAQEQQESKEPAKSLQIQDQEAKLAEEQETDAQKEKVSTPVKVLEKEEELEKEVKEKSDKVEETPKEDEETKAEDKVLTKGDEHPKALKENAADEVTSQEKRIEKEDSVKVLPQPERDDEQFNLPPGPEPPEESKEHEKEAPELKEEQMTQSKKSDLTKESEDKMKEGKVEIKLESTTETSEKKEKGSPQKEEGVKEEKEKDDVEEPRGEEGKGPADETKFIRPLPYDETIDSPEGLDKLLRAGRTLIDKESSKRKDEGEKAAGIPSAIAKLPRESREVIRTPDEVADLPVHEEVEPGTYETDELIDEPDTEEYSEEDQGVECIGIVHIPQSPSPQKQLEEQIDTTHPSEPNQVTKPVTLPEIAPLLEASPEAVTKIDAAVSPVLESLLGQSPPKTFPQVSQDPSKTHDSSPKAMPEIATQADPGPAQAQSETKPHIKEDILPSPDPKSPTTQVKSESIEEAKKESEIQIESEIKIETTTKTEAKIEQEAKVESTTGDELLADSSVESASTSKPEAEEIHEEKTSPVVPSSPEPTKEEASEKEVSAASKPSLEKDELEGTEKVEGKSDLISSPLTAEKSEEEEGGQEKIIEESASQEEKSDTKANEIVDSSVKEERDVKKGIDGKGESTGESESAPKVTTCQVKLSGETEVSPKQIDSELSPGGKESERELSLNMKPIASVVITPSTPPVQIQDRTEFSYPQESDSTTPSQAGQKTQVTEIINEPQKLVETDKKEVKSGEKAGDGLVSTEERKLSWNSDESSTSSQTPVTAISKDKEPPIPPEKPADVEIPAVDKSSIIEPLLLLESSEASKQDEPLKSSESSPRSSKAGSRRSSKAESRRSSKAEQKEEGGEKLFLLPGKDDDDDKSDVDDEDIYETDEPALGAVCSGLLTAATTLSAAVIAQSPEDLATITPFTPSLPEDTPCVTGAGESSSIITNVADDVSGSQKLPTSSSQETLEKVESGSSADKEVAESMIATSSESKTEQLSASSSEKLAESVEEKVSESMQEKISGSSQEKVSVSSAAETSTTTAKASESSPELSKPVAEKVKEPKTEGKVAESSDKLSETILEKVIEPESEKESHLGKKEALLLEQTSESVNDADSIEEKIESKLEIARELLVSSRKESTSSEVSEKGTEESELEKAEEVSLGGEQSSLDNREGAKDTITDIPTQQSDLNLIHQITPSTSTTLGTAEPAHTITAIRETSPTETSTSLSGSVIPSETLDSISTTAIPEQSDAVGIGNEGSTTEGIAATGSLDSSSRSIIPECKDMVEPPKEPPGADNRQQLEDLPLELANKLAPTEGESAGERKASVSSEVESSSAQQNDISTDSAEKEKQDEEKPIIVSLSEEIRTPSTSQAIDLPVNPSTSISSISVSVITEQTSASSSSIPTDSSFHKDSFTSDTSLVAPVSSEESIEIGRGQGRIETTSSDEPGNTSEEKILQDSMSAETEIEKAQEVVSAIVEAAEEKVVEKIQEAEEIIKQVEEELDSLDSSIIIGANQTIPEPTTGLVASALIGGKELHGEEDVSKERAHPDEDDEGSVEEKAEGESLEKAEGESSEKGATQSSDPASSDAVVAELKSIPSPNATDIEKLSETQVISQSSSASYSAGSISPTSKESSGPSLVDQVSIKSSALIEQKSTSLIEEKSSGQAELLKEQQEKVDKEILSKVGTEQDKIEKVETQQGSKAERPRVEKEIVESIVKGDKLSSTEITAQKLAEKVQEQAESEKVVIKTTSSSVRTESDLIEIDSGADSTREYVEKKKERSEAELVSIISSEIKSKESTPDTHTPSAQKVPQVSGDELSVENVAGTDGEECPEQSEDFVESKKDDGSPPDGDTPSQAKCTGDSHSSMFTSKFETTSLTTATESNIEQVAQTSSQSSSSSSQLKEQTKGSTTLTLSQLCEDSKLQTSSESADVSSSKTDTSKMEVSKQVVSKTELDNLQDISITHLSEKDGGSKSGETSKAHISKSEAIASMDASILKETTAGISKSEETTKTQVSKSGEVIITTGGTKSEEVNVTDISKSEEVAKTGITKSAEITKTEVSKSDEITKSDTSTSEKITKTDVSKSEEITKTALSKSDEVTTIDVSKSEITKAAASKSEEITKAAVSKSEEITKAAVSKSEEITTAALSKSEEITKAAVSKSEEITKTDITKFEETSKIDVLKQETVSTTSDVKKSEDILRADKSKEGVTTKIDVSKSEVISETQGVSKSDISKQETTSITDISTEMTSRSESSKRDVSSQQKDKDDLINISGASTKSHSKDTKEDSSCKAGATSSQSDTTQASDQESKLNEEKKDSFTSETLASAVTKDSQRSTLTRRFSSQEVSETNIQSLESRRRASEISEEICGASSVTSSSMTAGGDVGRGDKQFVEITNEKEILRTSPGGSYYGGYGYVFGSAADEEEEPQTDEESVYGEDSQSHSLSIKENQSITGTTTRSAPETIIRTTTITTTTSRTLDKPEALLSHDLIDEGSYSSGDFSDSQLSTVAGVKDLEEYHPDALQVSSKGESKTEIISKVETPAKTVTITKIETPGKTEIISETVSEILSKIHIPPQGEIISKVEIPARTEIISGSSGLMKIVSTTDSSGKTETITKEFKELPSSSSETLSETLSQFDFPGKSEMLKQMESFSNMEIPGRAEIMSKFEIPGKSQLLSKFDIPSGTESEKTVIVRTETSSKSGGGTEERVEEKTTSTQSQDTENGNSIIGGIVERVITTTTTTSTTSRRTTGKDDESAGTSSFSSEFEFGSTSAPSSSSRQKEAEDEDIVKAWGKPLGLPPVQSEEAAPHSNEPESSSSLAKGTPKKDKSVDRKNPGTPAKSSHSSSSRGRTHHRSSKNCNPIYVDLAYVPHHGNSNYCDSEFFRLIRARYYVFSGLEPSRQVFDGLLQGKQAWDDKNLEVTIIPTYDTDTLGYWVVDSEDALAEARIDLAPSASRCTINLQDHETSCSAYRLEF